MNEQSKSPSELQRDLGGALHAIRMSRRQTQAEVAAKAGVALRSLASLERGEGSSVETLVRTLHALEATDAISKLAPTPQVSPLAMLRHESGLAKRVRHRRSAK